MFLGRRLAGRFCLALVALALYGCPEDAGGVGDDPPEGGPAKINLLVNARCGNKLAIPTSLQEIESGEAMTAEVLVQGIDPGQSSREILPGTEVTLFIADEKGEPGARGGQFSSGSAISSGIRFNGGRASDRFICTAPGIVNIHAQVGTLKDGKIAAPEYPPGSGQRPVIRTDKTQGGFPILCVSREEYEDDCGSVPPPDAGLGDGGVLDDGGPDGGDAGDAGDGGMPDAEILPPRYSLSYDSPPSAQLIMVIRDSFRTGASDFKELTFRLTDKGEAPRERIEVRFDVGESRQAGVTVLPEVAETDAEGYVTVQVRAGGTPGIVTVFAKARIAGLDRDLEAQSPPITIRAGLPSKRGLFFVCEEPVVSAFSGRSVLDPSSWSVYLRDNTKCVVQLVDRASGRVDEPTQVFFYSEAGSVTQADDSDMIGIAETLLRSGPPAPFDVPPQDYEREAGLVTGDPVAGELNPRDGLVTIIAVTRGEEEFTDVNGDLVYDEGIDVFEPRHDLPEPFIDRNDNGVYDDGELFRDLNRSGSWDNSNGRWDNITDIWDEVRVLWVGDMDPSPGRTLVEVGTCSADFECYDEPDDIHFNCRDADFFLKDGGRVDIAMRFTDSNGNCVNGYDESNVTVTVEGPLDVVTQDAFDITLPECFAGGCGGLCPAPRTYIARVADNMRNVMPGQPPPPAVPATVSIVLHYQSASGEIVNQPFFIRGCVQ